MLYIYISLYEIRCTKYDIRNTKQFSFFFNYIYIYIIIYNYILDFWFLYFIHFYFVLYYNRRVIKNAIYVLHSSVGTRRREPSLVPSPSLVCNQSYLRWSSAPLFTTAVGSAMLFGCASVFVYYGIFYVYYGINMYNYCVVLGWSIFHKNMSGLF